MARWIELFFNCFEFLLKSRGSTPNEATTVFNKYVKNRYFIKRSIVRW